MLIMMTSILLAADPGSGYSQPCCILSTPFAMWRCLRLWQFCKRFVRRIWDKSLTQLNCARRRGTTAHLCWQHAVWTSVQLQGKKWHTKDLSLPSWN